MTIAFATVFLGLMLGVHPVPLAVGPGVARVELLLDGEVVGQRTEPPWEIPCDFGANLAPHELVAVARNAAGEEVGRAGQWINFPRFGKDRAKVSLDPAAVVPDRTPVAVEVGRRDQDLDVRALAGRLVADGRPVDALAVETGPAEVVVVMNRAARDVLAEMAGFQSSIRATRQSITEAPIDYSDPARPHSGDWLVRGGESSIGVMDRRQERLWTEMRLEEGQFLRLLWPQRNEAPMVLEEGDEVRPDRFDHSRAVSPSSGGLLWLLSLVDPSFFSPGGQRLADSVAVAGLAAAVTGRRRAVVLILGGEPPDPSRLSPAAVRGYLRDLGVPLYVWAVGPVPDEVAEAWGGVRSLPKKRELRRAVKELSKSLERQRIVWIDGVHLPQEVALTGAEGDLVLVR